MIKSREFSLIISGSQAVISSNKVALLVIDLAIILVFFLFKRGKNKQTNELISLNRNESGFNR